MAGDGGLAGSFSAGRAEERSEDRPDSCVTARVSLKCLTLREIERGASPKMKSDIFSIHHRAEGDSLVVVSNPHNHSGLPPSGLSHRCRDPLCSAPADYLFV